MLPKTYTCCECGGTFEYAWTEEEALAEKEKLWGNIPIEACDIMCDKCFQKIIITEIENLPKDQIH